MTSVDMLRRAGISPYTYVTHRGTIGRQGRCTSVTIPIEFLTLVSWQTGDGNSGATLPGQDIARHRP
jgi:hypothetical protein